MIDPTNRNSALASALASELARSGVRLAVLSPGSRSTPVALALDREPGIEVVVVLDERSAGFFALGAALASGVPAAVACTSGSAAANLHPAIVEADEAGVPLVVLTSDRPPELRGIGAGQTIDQIKLYGDAVRWFCEVGTHDADDAGLLHLRRVGCRAVAEARSGPGPVHLNLSWREPLGAEHRPEDVGAGSGLARDGRGERTPLTELRIEREAAPETLDRVAGLLESRPRGLLVAGRQPDPALAGPIAELAAALGYPVLAEPTSQLRLGRHDRSRVICAYDLIVREPPTALEPELVVRFGDAPTSKPLRQWLARADGPDQIVVDPPGRWNEPAGRASTLIRADPASFAKALVERIGREPDHRWLGSWLSAERDAQEAIEEVLGEHGGGISEPALLRALGAVVGDDEQLLVASSMPIRDAEAFIASGPAGVGVFANRGANGIDGLVATAAGLARGGVKPTWLVLGDLALAHDVGGLATAAEAGAPLRVVVIDNGGGRIFEFLPQADEIDRERFERLFATPTPLDFIKVAELFDLPYRRLESGADLDLADERGPVLMHAKVPAAGNVELHRRIAVAVAERIRT